MSRSDLSTIDAGELAQLLQLDRERVVREVAAAGIERDAGAALVGQLRWPRRDVFAWLKKREADPAKTMTLREIGQLLGITDEGARAALKKAGIESLPQLEIGPPYGPMRFDRGRVEAWAKTRALKRREIRSLHVQRALGTAPAATPCAQPEAQPTVAIAGGATCDALMERLRRDLEQLEAEHAAREAAARDAGARVQAQKDAIAAVERALGQLQPDARLQGEGTAAR